MPPVPEAHTRAHTTRRDLNSSAKLQKAVMREGDGNRVNRSEAAGTIGIGCRENILFFFDRGRKTPRIHDRYRGEFKSITLSK